MSSQPDVVARLQGVTHRYGKTTAVESLALELPAGRLIGFIGPDGVGKSTVLALISGVRKIQSGRVEVLGNDVEDARTRAALCARIAYMPARFGKKSLSDPIGAREHRLLRTPLRSISGRARGADRRIACQHRFNPIPRSPGRQAVGRNEAKARVVLLIDPRPRSAHPRRTHHRRRSTIAPAILGACRTDTQPPSGHERAGGDCIHGGSGTFRTSRRYGRGARCSRPGPRTNCVREPTHQRWKRPS